MQETRVWSLGLEDPLEEGMVTHSSILAWRIPWTEEPGGLQSIRLPRDTTEGLRMHTQMSIYNIVLISAVQASDSVLHTYVCIHISIFLYSFPLYFISGYWIQFPVLYNRTLWFIHPICNSLHLLIPNFQSKLPHSPSLLASTNLFSVSVSLFLFHR